MNVSLTTELQKFVQDKVKSGLYRSASEVIRDSLRWLRKQEAQLADVRHEIDKGLRDIKEERVEELNIEEILSEAKALHAKQKKHS